MRSSTTSSTLLGIYPGTPLPGKVDPSEVQPLLACEARGNQASSKHWLMWASFGSFSCPSFTSDTPEHQTCDSVCLTSYPSLISLKQLTLQNHLLGALTILLAQKSAVVVINIAVK